MQLWLTMVVKQRRYSDRQWTSRIIVYDFRGTICSEPCVPITPVPAQLHWLPIAYWVKFKLYVFKSLNGLAPEYMSSLLQPYRPCRAVRSADQHLLSVPRTRTKRFCDRTCRRVAPGLWNALPINVRMAESVQDG
jgi:hypothetical protein